MQWVEDDTRRVQLVFSQLNLIFMERLNLKCHVYVLFVILYKSIDLSTVLKTYFVKQKKVDNYVFDRIFDTIMDIYQIFRNTYRNHLKKFWSFILTKGEEPCKISTLSFFLGIHRWRCYSGKQKMNTVETDYNRQSPLSDLRLSFDFNLQFHQKDNFV